MRSAAELGWAPEHITQFRLLSARGGDRQVIDHIIIQLTFPSLRLLVRDDIMDNRDTADPQLGQKGFCFGGFPVFLVSEMSSKDI